ncbi:hypothetical protein SPACI_049300 [Sporomusa acidovorans DSM 3132]|uniref:Uncharacterized protein n=1 Tax=Sporomusa acidovorans (strain ATCC 49682 / DSM 3132 / Mol) TaxID=1123286 RepID=A0ABZ3J9Z1_SPOA4|nr:hypothetical protein SPACI_45760 [Sporomusa acidovorans DSM 3132]SDE31343.1 hypothetical protein SAMN04488499_101176 [Sporomusa acidovorans]
MIQLPICLRLFGQGLFPVSGSYSSVSKKLLSKADLVFVFVCFREEFFLYAAVVTIFLLQHSVRLHKKTDSQSKTNEDNANAQNLFIDPLEGISPYLASGNRCGRSDKNLTPRHPTGKKKNQNSGSVHYFIFFGNS